MRTDTTLTAEALLFDMDGTLVDSTVVVERTWRRSRGGTGSTRRRSSPRRTDAGRRRPWPCTRRRARTPWPRAPGWSGGDRGRRGHRRGSRRPGRTGRAARGPLGRGHLRRARTRPAPHGGGGLEPPRLLVTADDVAAGKPDPEGYLKAAAALGLSPAAAVVFEDAEAGWLPRWPPGRRLSWSATTPAPPSAGCLGSGTSATWRWPSGPTVRRA
ncbi:HAD-IA family hydrolase [Streptomyces sp. M19]